MPYDLSVPPGRQLWLWLRFISRHFVYVTLWRLSRVILHHDDWTILQRESCFQCLSLSPITVTTQHLPQSTWGLVWGLLVCSVCQHPALTVWTPLPGFTWISEARKGGRAMLSGWVERAESAREFPRRWLQSITPRTHSQSCSYSGWNL